MLTLAGHLQLKGLAKSPDETLGAPEDPPKETPNQQHIKILPVIKQEKFWQQEVKVYTRVDKNALVKN